MFGKRWQSLAARVCIERERERERGKAEDITRMKTDALFRVESGSLGRQLLPLLLNVISINSGVWLFVRTGDHYLTWSHDDDFLLSPLSSAYPEPQMYRQISLSSSAPCPPPARQGSGRQRPSIRKINLYSPFRSYDDFECQVEPFSPATGVIEARNLSNLILTVSFPIGANTHALLVPQLMQSCCCAADDAVLKHTQSFRSIIWFAPFGFSRVGDTRIRKVRGSAETERQRIYFIFCFCCSYYHYHYYYFFNQRTHVILFSSLPVIVCICLCVLLLLSSIRGKNSCVFELND